MNKKCIVYIVNSDFYNNFKLSIYSLISNNIDLILSADFIVYTERKLFDNIRVFCKKLNIKSLILKDLADYDYSDIKFDKQRKWGLNPAYRFELFRIKGYKKILYLDCDTLILKNISNLLNYKSRKLMVCKLHKATNFMFFKNFFQGFNAGVLLIPGNLTADKIYSNLILMCREYFFKGNQEPLNIVFRNKTKFLPQKYNVTTDLLNITNIKTANIIHYIGAEKFDFNTMQLDFSRYVSLFMNKLVAVKLNNIFIKYTKKLYEFEQN
jgi:lipopolysaccharide biosynthesis glycosyltransferase